MIPESIVSRRVQNMRSKASKMTSNTPQVDQVAEYLDRDLTTGERLLLGSDGGIIRTSYLSNSVPEKNLKVSTGSLGQPGFSDQRPGE